VIAFDAPRAKRETLRARRERYKIEQRCRDCGAKLLPDDSTRCDGCAEAAREHNRRWLARGGREKRNSWMRAQYARRRAAGLCGFCDQPAELGYAFCHGHRMAHNRRRRTS